MLTADLVRVRRKGDELIVSPLGPRNRPIAELLATQLVELAAEHVGQTKDRWTAARALIQVPARARKLADGLVKLIEDRCTFAMDEGVDPIALRDAVFAAASSIRAALGPGEPFDRDAVLAAVGAEHGLDPEAAEARLYGDLKAAWRLQAFDPIEPLELVDRYETSQGQAVLLRATRVTAVVHRAKPAALRRLFRKLKFLRLIHVIRPVADGATRIDLDGPASLFESSTKYGLQLALLLPALERTGPWSLDAEVLWGPAKDRCRLHLEGVGKNADEHETSALPDEVETLLERLRKKPDGWTFSINRKVLDLPGVGLCVPDLVAKKEDQRVYVEVLGFWSRPAVWKRVELVEKGLRHKILFCVSSRLRVGEAALGDDLPGSLYVYKSALSAKIVLARLEDLRARGHHGERGTRRE